MHNFYHTINLNALSSVILYSNVNCAEYKEFQWKAAAVFELTSDIPDSNFHFDFEDCNICLKSKNFNEITVQLQVHIAIHFVTSVHNSNINFERHQHLTERDIGEWEEHLKVS